MTGRGLFVILLPTLECNLTCSYCFEDHPKGRWDVPTTASILNQVFELARRQKAEHLTLHWQGGEALLLGVEYWQEVCELAVALGRKQGLSVDQRLQTNLVQYRSELATLAHRYFDGKLGTSYEPDTRRRYFNDDGSRFQSNFQQAFRAAVADGLEVGVISLLSEPALDLGAEKYLEKLRDLGMRRVRINLPFDQSESGRHGYWLDPIRAGVFLADAYRWWVAQGRDEAMYIKPFRFLEDLLLRGDTREPGLCIFTSNCADVSLTVSTGGLVTLCDSFVNSTAIEPFGNVFEEPLWQIYEGEKRRKARRTCAAQLKESCMGCRYIPVCYGGCPVRSHLQSDGSYHYCETYKILYSTIEGRQLLHPKPGAEPRADGRAAVRRLPVFG